MGTTSGSKSKEGRKTAIPQQNEETPIGTREGLEGTDEVKRVSDYRRGISMHLSHLLERGIVARGLHQAEI